MGLWRGEDRSIELFASRFEEDSDRYLFRAGPRIAPVPVTVAERDEEIARYRRSRRYLFFGALVILLIAIIALAVSVPQTAALDPHILILPLILVWLVPFVLIWLRLWNMPVRRFENRLPVGAGRTAQQARRFAFERLKWTKLAVVPVIALVILIPRHDESTSGWWFDIKLVFAGLLILLAIVQAFRKWRFERGGG